MDSLYTVQRSLFTLYNLLPAVIMVTLLTVGFGLGNYGMITILTGQFAISLVVFFLRLLPQWITGEEKQLFSLFPGEFAPQFPSMWIANIVFFFGCIIWNAYDLYKMDSPAAAGSDATIGAKVNNRKSRTMMIIVTCALLLLMFIGYRLFWVEFVQAHMGSSIIGSLLSIGIGVGAIAIWHAIIQQPNFGIKNMDIFGISQQLVSVKNADIRTMCELKA